MMVSSMNMVHGMANNFCPLINRKCKKEECMFWIKKELEDEKEVVFSEENCVLLSYLTIQVDKMEKALIEARSLARERERTR
jgi:hypothetical protein